MAMVKIMTKKFGFWERPELMFWDTNLECFRVIEVPLNDDRTINESALNEGQKIGYRMWLAQQEPKPVPEKTEADAKCKRADSVWLTYGMGGCFGS
jgi:hypothetical protein